MKNLFKLFFALLLLATLCTQALAGNKNPGKVNGRLLEPASKEPVAYATVGLFSGRDSSLTGSAISDEAGRFAIENIPAGNYYLHITLVGFNPKKLANLKVDAAQPVLDLGTVMMPSSAQKIAEVEIVAQKELVEYGLDKQVINVAKDLSSTGGTASDALKNVPSVAVDIDGNVSVRGSSNVTVLVDGKTSGQNAQTILSKTPASAIEKIEVITNPSAKYDAEGMGGIINIILKKENKPGLNGNVAVNLGTGNNYNSSLNLNYNLNKFNFFAGYDFNQHARTSNYQLTSYRKGNLLQQNQTGDRLGRYQMARIGFDLQLTDKQSLTFSARAFSDDMHETGTVYNKTVTSKAAYFTRDSRTENEVLKTDLIFNYKKTFEEKRRELSAGAIYMIIDGRFDGYITHYNTNADRETYGTETYENYPQLFYLTPLIANVDYVHPVGEKGKIETGLKHTARVLTTEFRTERAGPGYTNLTVIDSLSNDFGFNDYINAAYANYANSWDKISYQVGVRAEQTNTRISKLSDKDKTRSYLDFFPSVFLSYELDENRKVQLNYSRRINRPNYEALNPFKNYSDQYNVWTGNPEINPEYIDAYEASYINFWKTGSLTSTAFYRNVHNLIQQVRYVDPIDSLVAYNTYTNLNNARSYGLELSGSQTLNKWLKLNGNASAFNYQITGNPLGVEAASNSFTWQTRLNANVTLPENLTAQVSFNYRGPQALAQGTRAAMYNTDIALKKDVFKKKASITLRVSDIFNTLRYNTSVADENFTYDLQTKRLSRIAYLGFSYRFGDEKRRRPETNSGMDNMF